MKKVLFILFVLILFTFIFFISFADSEYSTLVEYLGEGTEEFTLTVPAKLAPNTSGEVKVTGVWPSNRQLIVDADNTVELVNEGNVLNKKVLNIDFDGIKLIGNDVKSVTQTENIYVAKMPDDVLFGTWSGRFNYIVEMTEVSNVIDFVIEGETFQADRWMTWIEWYNSDYSVGSPVGYSEEDGYLYVNGLECIYLNSPVEENIVDENDYIISGGNYGNYHYIIESSPIFYIDNQEYHFYNGMSWGEWMNSKYSEHGTFHISSGYICTMFCEEGKVHLNNILVMGSDIIKANARYETYISFYIGENRYTSAPNLTWESWLSSTTEFPFYRIDNDGVYLDDYSGRLLLNGVPIKGSDQIIKDSIYEIET